MKEKEAQQYCQNKAIKSGSSFYYSFLFLTQKKKVAITTVYAFCREIDDIVDECTNKDIAALKLKWWEEEIEKIFNGTEGSHPISKAIKRVLDIFPLKKHLFLEIIQGMHMDLKYQGYQTFEDLKLYCHCVASAVGLLVAEIFGYTNIQTLEYARNLGLALQMINIIRDIGEDAMRGRIYLPEEDLIKFNIDATSLLQGKYNNKENFIQLMQLQAQRARDFYATALKSLPNEDRSNQKAGIIMAKIYLALLNKIEKSNFDVLTKKISLTPITKLWLAFKANLNIQKNLQKAI